MSDDVEDDAEAGVTGRALGGAGAPTLEVCGGSPNVTGRYRIVVAENPALAQEGGPA
jgi:hypothetical protein